LNYFASVLKLAIHCKVSKQIVGGLPTSYPKEEIHGFFFVGQQ